MILLTNIALALIGFYILIAVGFLPQLLGCHLQTVLNTNMFAKHSLGFILLIMLVVIVNPVNADLRFLQIIGISIAVYIWFLITTRAHYAFVLITLVLLMIVYILDSTKARYIKLKNTKKIKLIENIQISLVVTAVVINIIGFTIYIIEKKREYGKKFKLLTFIVGKPACKNFSPNNSKIIKDY